MVYVDDCAIAYDKQSQPLFDTFCVDLAKDFKYTNRGDLQWFLGFQVTRDRKAGTLKIDQGSFVRNMLAYRDSKRKLMSAWSSHFPIKTAILVGQSNKLSRPYAWKALSMIAFTVLFFSKSDQWGMISF